MASKFSQSDVTFKDTRKAGGISVRGIQVETDEDGFIEAPADLAKEIEPHGFIRADRPTAESSKTLSLKK